MVDGETLWKLDLFSVGHGVKQGCVLAPTLFTIFLAAVLQNMPEGLGDPLYEPEAMAISSILDA